CGLERGSRALEHAHARGCGQRHLTRSAAWRRQRRCVDLRNAQGVEEPEGADQVDEGIGATELVEVNLRLREVMEPRLRAPQALERAQSRTLDLIGNFGGR